MQNIRLTCMVCHTCGHVFVMILFQKNVSCTYHKKQNQKELPQPTINQTTNNKKNSKTRQQTSKCGYVGDLESRKNIDFFG